MRVHWLQHVEFEAIGAIGEWAEGIAGIAEHCRDELVSGPFIQGAGDLAPSESRLHDARAHLHFLLDRLPLHASPGV